MLNQITSRILLIYCRDELGYKNITLEKIVYPTSGSEITNFWRAKESDALISIGTWMYIEHPDLPFDVHTIGRLSKGRFGWFVPRDLINDNEEILFSDFQTPNSSRYERFLFDEKIIKSFCKQNLIFKPDHCENRNCVTFLAGDYNETAFIKQQIIDLKLYVKVRWLGNDLFDATKHLVETLRLIPPKAFVTLHRTPSDVVNAYTEYKSVVMPTCNETESNEDNPCRYETVPIMKMYTSGLALDRRVAMSNALRSIKFNVAEEIKMLNEFAKENLPSSRNKLSNEKLDSRYDAIACNWIRNNENVWSKWNTHSGIRIIIGAMFPNSEITGENNLESKCSKQVINSFINFRTQRGLEQSN